MIEKLKRVDESDFPYKDENGVHWSSKKSYLQQEFLDFYGCGSPDAAMVFIRDVLSLIKNGNGWGNPEIEALLPNEGIYHFVFYVLDHKGFIEHGTSIGGSWITDKGKELLVDIEWCIENEKDIDTD
jgi:hypothetical protein